MRGARERARAGILQEAPTAKERPKESLPPRKPPRWSCRRTRDRARRCAPPASPPVLYVNYTVCRPGALPRFPPSNPSPPPVRRHACTSARCVVSVRHVCVGFTRPVDKCLSVMPAVRKYRRDTSEVSCCLKYVIFGFNVMFWVSTAREPQQSF